MSVEMAGNSQAFGYTGQLAKPVHSSPLAPTGGLAVPRQLTANQAWSIGGPAQAVIGRVGHMTRGITEARGSLPAAAGGVAEGIGAVTEEGAPLLLAA